MLIWNAPVVAGAYPTLLPIAGSSTAAAGSMTATLAGAAAKMTFISGFDVTSGNATVAGNVNITVTGLPITLNFNMYVGNNAGNSTITSGVATAGQLSIRFPEPLPASASNTAINVIVPALPSGNLAAAVTAFGFQTPLASGQS